MSPIEIENFSLPLVHNQRGVIGKVLLGGWVEVRIVQGVHTYDLLAGKFFKKLVDLLVEPVQPQFYAVASLDGFDADFSVAADLFHLL